MNILLAVDGSEVSVHAVRSLAAHVEQFRVKPHVDMLYVHPPVPVGLATHPLSQQTLETYYREEGESALLVARQMLLDAGVPFTPHIHVGSPAELIVKLAHEFGCQLICMGSHGHGALQNAILGSVASKVLHLAAGMPVMLVK